jgi:hypothetical protein
MLAQVRTLLQEEDVDHQSLLEIALADGQTMFTFQTSGSKAVDYWHRLRETGSKAAKASPDGNALLLTPVILGTDQSFELLMEHLGDLSEEPPASTQALIAQANNIDCQNWLAERLERFVCPNGRVALCYQSRPGWQNPISLSCKIYPLPSIIGTKITTK